MCNDNKRYSYENNSDTSIPALTTANKSASYGYLNVEQVLFSRSIHRSTNSPLRRKSAFINNESHYSEETQEEVSMFDKQQSFNKKSSEIDVDVDVASNHTDANDSPCASGEELLNWQVEDLNDLEELQSLHNWNFPIFKFYAKSPENILSEVYKTKQDKILD